MTYEYTIAVCTVKTPDDGQRNCPKYVEFYSKNKFEKLVHLVGFITGIRVSCYGRSLLSVPGDQKLSYATAMSKTQSNLPVTRQETLIRWD